MNGYIDVDKLIEFANNTKDKTIDANDIARFPAADVVEVVRCKDCKYAPSYNIYGSLYCLKHNDVAVDGNDFCSYGERKDE